MQDVKKVYVAGPMRGYEHFNFPAFHEASVQLKEVGIRVINPAALDEAYGFDPMQDPVTDELVRQCVRRDVDAICQVDAVVVIKGWENSAGATAEVAVAKWLGLPVYTLAEALGGGDHDDWHH